MSALRILHLEDNSIDAKLIREILLEDWDVTVTVVEDGDSFQSELLHNSFDCILADYTLPAFDGLGALNIAKKHSPNLPFILVSGTLGEEVAIECMKSGATDYVLKTSLSRLVPSIKRALKEKEEVNKRRQLEGRLREAQKLESIGTLAGGIAHDFNNILTAILGYGGLALDQVSKDSELANDLNSIISAAERATGLVQQILAFSKQSKQECILMEMPPLVKEVAKLIRATIPSTIDIQQKIDSECGSVFANPTQMHQVLMNLCTNSFHAMRDQGGTLAISLFPVDIEEAFIDKIGEPIVPGKYLKLTVSDTGCGMERNTLEKIFEPYFTTKKKGEGTGLGMSVVHGIITKIGGTIKAESAVGEGTVIDVYIPVSGKEVGVSDKKNDAIAMSKGNERIIVVDDEAPIALMFQKILTRLGYQVTTFTSSEAALQTIKSNISIVDLVITDMAMPNMSGVQLSAEILKINPDMPIILCSGFSDNIDKNKAIKMGIKDYILKPISKRKLSEAVSSVLSQAMQPRS